MRLMVYVGVLERHGQAFVERIKVPAYLASTSTRDWPIGLFHGWLVPRGLGIKYLGEFKTDYLFTAQGRGSRKVD